MNSAELTPAIVSRTDNRAADQHFYVWSAVAALAIVFVGFARTYFLRFLFHPPALSWFLWGHGTLMMGWFVLFFVQTALVRAHRVALHKRLGMFGAAYAALMVISSLAVATHAAARDVRVPHFKGAPLMFMGGLFILIFVFAVLVAAAILLRHRREYHKRLMLLSVLSMISPALFRIPFERIPALAFLNTRGVFSLDLLLLYGCVAWDTWRHRRLHPAFAVGVLLIIAENTPLVGLFVRSTLCTRFATWLVS
jgi:hypothetical protein